MFANVPTSIPMHTPPAGTGVETSSAAGQLHVSNTLLRALTETVRHHGVTPEALLGRGAERIYSEPPEQTRAFAEVQLLLDHAVELTGEPALGLMWGMRASESSFGVLGTLVATARSLRHAVSLVSEFHGLVGEGLELHLSEHQGVARIHCHMLFGSDPSRHVVLSELLMTGLFRMLKTFGCTAQDILKVSFEHDRPTHHAVYLSVFEGKANFSQEATYVELASEALDRPHLHHHAEMYSLVLAQAQRSIRLGTGPSRCSERVRMLLSCSPLAQLPDMTQAARRLGLSVRSLRRRLDDEGTSYRELTQALLYESAQTMLRNRDLTLQEIAHALGFGDSAAFHRAFRRWAKRTPASYRASLSADLGDESDDYNTMGEATESESHALLVSMHAAPEPLA